MGLSGRLAGQPHFFVLYFYNVYEYVNQAILIYK